MYFTNGQLKYAARYKLRRAGFRPILATLMLLVILTAMGLLLLRMIGYLDYLQAVYTEYVDVLETEYFNLGDRAESFMELYSGMLDGLYKAMNNVPEWTIPPVGGLLGIALGLMMQVFVAGHSLFCFLVSREEKPKYRELTAGFFCMGKVLGLYVIRGIIVLAGLMLFVLPGVFLWYRYRLAVFVLWEHPEYGVIRCLRESGKAGNALRLLGLDLSFLGWHILNYILMALVTTPAALLWIMPFSQVTRAEYYNRAVGWNPSMRKKEPPEEEAENRSEEE